MRSSRLPLVLALAVVVLAAGLGSWLLLRPSSPQASGREAHATPRAPASPAPLPATPAGGDLAEAARESVEAARTDPTAPPPDDAQWVDVTVVAPAGTPLDEELVVVGTARGLATHDHGAGNEAPRAVFEARPDASGRLRVPFLAAARQGTLDLRGHYLYLDEPVEVSLPAEGPLVLEPRLGARLRARFELPSPLPAGFDPASMATAEARLYGWSAGGRGHDASRTLDGTLVLDAGGLRPGLTYALSVELPELVDVSDRLPSLEPGQVLERRYALVVGATLRGRVVDEGGTGVEGARVAVDQEAGGNGLFSLSFGGRGGAVTAADGAFELRGVAPRPATLTASHEGHLDSAPLELEPADLEVVEGLELVLPSGARLSGRVGFPDGRPARGARVTLTEPVAQDSGRRVWVFDQSHSDSADAEGRFAFAGLGEGPFQVRVEADVVTDEAASERVRRHTSETWRVTAEQVLPGAELALVLEPPIVVRGRAVDDTGAAVTRFSVLAVESGADERPWTVSAEAGGDEIESEDGSFELRSLGRGTWKLSLEAEGHGDSEERLVTLPGDSGPFTFVLPRAGSLSGRVLDPGGRPAAAAEVELSRAGAMQRWSRESDSVEADAEGRFRFEQVAPGAVELIARGDDLAPSEALALEVVPAVPQEGLELRLRLGGTLAGEVYRPDGTVDPGRQVMVQQPMAEPDGRSTTTDAGGRFRIEHLAPGRYQVAALPDMDVFGAGEADPVEMLQQLRMTTAEVRDGEITHVVLGAPPDEPVALTGVVREGGRPAGGMMLVALAEGGAMLSSLKSARTAADGSFALTLPAPGDWILMVGEDMDGEGSEFPVTVPAAERHHVELEIPAGRISGRVLLPDGAPAASVQVSLVGGRAVSIFSTSGGRETQSDADGRFVFERVRPGAYELRAGADAAAGFFGAAGPGYGMALLSGLDLEAGGALDGLVLQLVEPGTIRGVVRQADGSAAAEASVWVRDAAGRVLNTRSWCVTDGFGRFTFQGAGRGRYTVLARKPGLASQEVAVDVTEGAESAVELTLEAGTMLLVAVEDEEGNALRATLRVYDEADREVSGLSGVQDMERTLTEGFSTREQHVGPLAPGRYRVEAVAEDGARAVKPVSLSGQDERRVRLRLKE